MSSGIYIDHRLGSYDFSTGAGGRTGKLLFFVLGVDTHEAAQAEVEAHPDFAEQINGFLLDDIQVSDQGGTLYFVDVNYRRGVPSDAGPTPGSTPESARQAPQGHNNQDPLPRDVTFSMGGEQITIYQSLETIGRHCVTGDQPSDFRRLIGYDRKTKEIRGCQVLAPNSDFTVTKRFQQLTVGWFRTCLEMVATTNKTAFLGLYAGECLFKGADGQYKDGDKTPWTVTARWGYSMNRSYDEDPDDPALTIPTSRGDIIIDFLYGHNYVWHTSITVKQPVLIDGKVVNVDVEEPLNVFVERVYPERDHNELGFN